MKIKFPTMEGRTAPRGLSTFYVPADALERWNPALSVKAAADEGEASISIFDIIGETWDGSGVTVNRIGAVLRSIGPGKTVLVNINSPGGDLFEGAAIYNVLRDYDGTIITRVVGVAASAASVIAMAGQKIQTARAGWVMVHNSWVIALGNRNDLRAVADWLEPFDDVMADVYSARTKKDKKKCMALMDKETWFSGSQAIKEGFADEYLPADQIEEKDDAAAAARRNFAAMELSIARRGLRVRRNVPPIPAQGVETRTVTLDSIKVEAREGGGFRIVGHGAVFNQWSEDLGGFREKIAPGAFKRVIGRDDVRALFNHDENFVLGRSTANTLTLSEDDKGLQVSVDAPDTQWMRDLAVSIERKDIKEMSFAFSVDREGQEWRKNGDLYERTVNQVSRLWDVSVVTFPAYPQTDAALRTLRLVEADVERAAWVEQARARVEGQRQATELEARRQAQRARLVEIDL